MASPAPATTTTLPADFLTSPAPPNLTTTRLDFSTSALPVYANCYATVIDGALTPHECALLLRHAHASTGGTWERAMINMGGGREALASETRNCGRLILDDADLVARIWARVAPAVPELAGVLEGPRWCVKPLKYWTGWEEEWETEGGGLGSALHDRQVDRGERWRCVGLNERMRFLRYVGGEYFRPHCDGTYVTPEGMQRSFFTLHLYLNDGEEVEGGGDEERRSPFVGEEGEPVEGLRGGATTFHGPNDMFALQFGDPGDGVERLKVDVVPRVGRVLLFQHRHMVHSGDDVVAGVKYTMRTDVMFEKEVKAEE